jgi:plasmid stability protein
MAVQLHLGIDDDLQRELQAHATAYGISVAAAVRILLRDALAAYRAQDGSARRG